MAHPTRSARTWISPLTGLSFVTIGVTGTLMLFHVQLPGMVMLHELGGALFVVIAVLHLRANWRQLLFCCRQKAGRIALGIGATLLAFLLLLGLGHEQHHRQRGEPIHAYEQGQRR